MDDITYEVGLSVVQEFARRFQAGDRDGAFELLHPEFEIEQPASLPHGGRYRGGDGMLRMASVFSEHWDRTITDPRILGCGASVVQITSQTWTSKRTGRTATVDVVELFDVSDERVAQIRVFQQDTYLLMSTLLDEEST